MSRACPAPVSRRTRFESRALACSIGLPMLVLSCAAFAQGVSTLTLAEAERLAIERDAVLHQLAAESLAMRVPSGKASGTRGCTSARTGVRCRQFSRSANGMV